MVAGCLDSPGLRQVALKAVRERFASLDEWSIIAVAEAIDDTADEFELNLGKLGQPLRIAVTGGPVSPPIDVTVWLVGRERTLVRLDQAIEIIAARAAANAN